MSARSPTPKPRVFVEKWLYVSHFFSAWVRRSTQNVLRKLLPPPSASDTVQGWRKYEYGIGLLLASLWPDSVLLP